mgnify:FL=1|tara:strand:- start:11888 stop:12346 length:459 start_codon:yes stop_codon:yes gene_type:complete
MAEYRVWLVAASVIIVVLAVIAGRLLWQLRAQQRREEAERLGYESESAVQRKAAREGISILVRSYIAGQVGASECALRVAVLSETAAMDAAFSADIGVFRDMAAALAHIPTHAGWKALSSAQRAAYTTEMADIEAQYSDSLQLASERLSRVA